MKPDYKCIGCAEIVKPIDKMPDCVGCEDHSNYKSENQSMIENFSNEELLWWGDEIARTLEKRYSETPSIVMYELCKRFKRMEKALDKACNRISTIQGGGTKEQWKEWLLEDAECINMLE